MDKEKELYWMELGARLAAAGPEKFDQIFKSIEKIVEAQEVLARFDWQLPFRGRPRKRYLA